MEILEFIKREKVIFNISVDNMETALKLADIAVTSRSTLLSVEMNFKDAAAAIKKIVEKYETKGVVVGASNAQTEGDIKYAVDAGAQFVLSLFHMKGMIIACNEEDCVGAVGALTPTEIKAAVEAGSKVIFLAPCAALSSDYIRFMTNAFGDIAFIAGGGINLKNFKGFLDSGASAVVTDIASPDDIAQEHYKKIGKDIAEFLEARDVMD